MKEDVVRKSARMEWYSRTETCSVEWSPTDDGGVGEGFGDDAEVGEGLDDSEVGEGFDDSEVGEGMDDGDVDVAERPDDDILPRSLCTKRFMPPMLP